MQSNIQFTESRYNKTFLSHEHLFVSRHFVECPQHAQQALMHINKKISKIRVAVFLDVSRLKFKMT